MRKRATFHPDRSEYTKSIIFKIPIMRSNGL